MLNGSTWFAGLLFVIAGIFALMLIGGYRTRLAVIASLAFTVSLHQRNPLVCNAGDQLLAVLLFWSVFLPLGAVWSLDRRRSLVTDAPRSVLTPASAGFLLQIAGLYFFSALHKQHAAWNVHYTATYLALMAPYASDLGRRAAEWPLPVLQFLTAYVYRLELYGWLLAFSPFRTNLLRGLVVAAFVSFHAALVLLMNLGTFAWISMSAWLIFLPGPFWDWIEQTVIFGSLRRRVEHILSSLDRRDAIPPRPSPSVESPNHDKPGPVAKWTPVVAMVYVVGINVASLSPAISAPDEFQRWGQWIGIYQRWRMFAPSPRRIHGWYVAPAQLADGKSIDLVRPDDPIVTEPAPRQQRGLDNRLWRSYLLALTSSRGHEQTPHYVRWLRRRWNERHTPDKHVKSVNLRFEIEFAMPPGRPPLRTSTDLYEWTQEGHENLAPLNASWSAVRASIADKFGR